MSTEILFQLNTQAGLGSTLHVDPETGLKWLREVSALRAQRDALLAACKAMRDNRLLADPSSVNHPERFVPTQVAMQVLAAIAACEERSGR